ncbi:transcriptional regulator, DeoR family [Paenibacillus sp. UNCCL117]|uniref:DeoR/GlpR family DNA-binding transcription regulator n=1 Tax=unclassified Paenibacillus TaxID=185978 RepID=UPI000883B210|nr:MULTISPECIES: DeoR/GlpR family DNA-binding transcription regulator [unclassified Paenibacillus]SDD12165.1 DNA-binding transcriptional regulator of sugar metabolism, DeoR/GlpR family [Paenibacillus sp. cl123]SFW33733.1 transcriptional regulator, DeoR family [Paenibacillus sp. UNCCL117]
MLAPERRNRIMQVLHEQKQLLVKEVSLELGVSEGTLRNDLKILEEDGLLERIHGGAVLPKPHTPEYTFQSRSLVNQEEKKQIGRTAAQLVKNGQCIILDASSTSLELARNLINHEYLTVVTNGLATAQELTRNPRISVIVIGGVLRPGSSSLEGLLGKGLLGQIHADVFFTSAHGFTPSAGLADFSIYEAELKKMMVANVSKVVALLDHSKLNRRSIASFAETSQIDTIVTDPGADREFLDGLEGIDVMIAD